MKVLEVSWGRSLVKGPESSISSESVVLNNWIGWIVLVLVLKIFLFITVGNLIRWLSMSVLGFSLGVGISSFLMKGPKSSISTESMVLNNRISRIVLILILEIFFLVSIGDFI